MAVQKIVTGNHLAEIAPLLENSGLFRDVIYNSSANTVTCYGADGKTRFYVKTGATDGNAYAEMHFHVSETDLFKNTGTVANTRALTVECVYTCAKGIVLQCVRGAVLLTKNNRGENLYVVTDWTAADRDTALRSLRVYSYGDRTVGGFPVNLVTDYNLRSGATVFVPFVSEPADSGEPCYAPDAFLTPFYQFTDSGAMTADGCAYLNFAGCWAIADE